MSGDSDYRYILTQNDANIFITEVITGTIDFNNQKVYKQNIIWAPTKQHYGTVATIKITSFIIQPLFNTGFFCCCSFSPSC